MDGHQRDDELPPAVRAAVHALFDFVLEQKRAAGQRRAAAQRELAACDKMMLELGKTLGVKPGHGSQHS